MKSLQKFIIEQLEPVQKIFVVVKPGSLNLCDIIIKRFEQDGWEVDKTSIKQLLPKEACELYYVHRKESFYKDLCKYMSSNLCRAFIFKKPGQQSEKTFKDVKKIKDEIREKYGESDMRNVIHSSDSEENMKKEASIFFRTI